jgi:hypothetical protein
MHRVEPIGFPARDIGQPVRVHAERDRGVAVTVLAGSEMVRWLFSPLGKLQVSLHSLQCLSNGQRADL